MTNVFLTDDIRIEYIDWNDDNAIERYELTKNKDNFIEHILEKENEGEPESTPKVTRESLQEMTMSELEEEYPEHWQSWNDSACHDEIYEVPMMNALRYYPDFVNFDEEDRYEVAGNTTLLYDNERRAWAVGMTGGGMDLSPDLLDTFIALGKGVPTELAASIRLNYSGNRDEQLHAENCKKLARAYLDYSRRMYRNAIDLDPSLEKDQTLKRHQTAIEKHLEKRNKCQKENCPDCKRLGWCDGHAQEAGDR